jgi:similar to spore coat protein
MKIQLAPHEAIEVRELISKEMLGIKKISASMNMVNDTELKNFMQDSLTAKKTALQNIQSVLS